MAPRTSWKGFLRLSLVSIPVKAFTASESGSEIRLNQLHRDCNSRIQYRKVCPTHGELKNDEIVKGYEFAKEQYVVIEPEELKSLQRENDRSIGLEGFIDGGTIDPIHHTGKTYYLAPDGIVGQKPYLLLHRTMVEKSLEAVARMVLSGREQLVLIRPIENLLGVTVLSYAAQVKPIADFAKEVGESEFSDEETKLTETLVDASRVEGFDFASYEDGHQRSMMELIEAKVEGKELVTAPSPEEPKILNLMEALKQSVANAQSAAPKAAPKKKMAKSAKKRAPAARSRKKSG